jgi:hypothetical protein
MPTGRSPGCGRQAPASAAPHQRTRPAAWARLVEQGEPIAHQPPQRGR